MLPTPHFVEAYKRFDDPEWDGEPVPPQPPGERREGEPADEDEPGGEAPERPQTIRIKLADGKERDIAHTMMTTYWHADGTPMSAQEFMKLLFGELPAFFDDEAELRQLWSAPDTRKKLLEGLASKGFGRDQLDEMQKIIDAEKSDLFDVLAYIAYTVPPLTRQERAAKAKALFNARFAPRQQAFLEFVLSHYVNEGVDELDQEKLRPLLRLKYHDSLPDAFADLGKPAEVSALFTDFQRYLYSSSVTQNLMKP